MQENCVSVPLPKFENQMLPLASTARPYGWRMEASVPKQFDENKGIRVVEMDDPSISESRLPRMSAPSPSLVLSAFRSVSHWQYKPYRVIGKPAIVETTVEAEFSLGG